MMVLSGITMFFLVPAVVAMAVGLGAIYPNFKSENPAQVVTSFGGLLFMILCFALIAIVIILEAGPTYYVFMANINNKPLSLWQVIWLIASFSIVCGLCAFAIFYPMRLGERSLRDK
jgi:ABC-2 type transport system permease protein